jgi:hypothetical protein
MILGAVAALGFGAMLALVLSGDGNEDVALLDASPAVTTPEASASPSASGSPMPRDATPGPSLTPEPTSGPANANLSIVEVRTDALNLRSQPGTDAPVIGTLNTGARLFTIGRPEDAGGERWYRVAVVAGPYSECEGTYCPSDIGWVAFGLSDADEAFLASTSVDCPSSPMSAEALAQLHPLERLSCYGGDAIVVTGTVDYCYCDGPLVVEYEPLWLAMPVSQFLFHGTAELWHRFEEDVSGPEGLEPGDIVEVTVAMEHEDAPNCTVSAPVGGGAPTQAQVVLGCRTQLVAENLLVTGHDPNVGR